LIVSFDDVSAFFIGENTTIYKNLDRETAEKHKKDLEDIGVEVSFKSTNDPSYTTNKHLLDSKNEAVNVLMGVNRSGQRTIACPQCQLIHLALNPCRNCH
jgi:hypothetical protein